MRNDLHFQSARSTDILSLDMQPRVAWNLGYRQGDTIQRVERFMQDYYRAAQAIHKIAQLVESRLSLSTGDGAPGATTSILATLKASRFRRSQRIDGFVLRGGELAAENPGVFTEDPVRMVRVFRHCQQLGCSLGFHLTELIRESLPLMANIAQSADAAVSFRAILSEVGAVYPTLARMHEMGVLGRFIPEFDALTCFVQHELYHRYTADVHTLNAIRELDLIFTDSDRVKTAVPRGAARDFRSRPGLSDPSPPRHRQGRGHQGPLGSRRQAFRSDSRSPGGVAHRSRISAFCHKESSRDGTILAEEGRR